MSYRLKDVHVFHTVSKRLVCIKIHNKSTRALSWRHVWSLKSVAAAASTNLSFDDFWSPKHYGVSEKLLLIQRLFEMHTYLYLVIDVRRTYIGMLPLYHRGRRCLWIVNFKNIVIWWFSHCCMFAASHRYHVYIRGTNRTGQHNYMFLNYERSLG